MTISPQPLTVSATQSGYANNLEQDSTTGQVINLAKTPIAPSQASNVLWTMGAVLVMLIGIKYLSEHEKSKMDVKLVGVGVYNIAIVTLMAILGLSVTKVIVNKYPVKGFTNLVNLV